MSAELPKGKIIVDSDWKAEAEAKKEQLAAEEQQQPGYGQPLPDPTFRDLINLIAMPAIMSLGGYRTPDGQVVPPDLQAAKYHIDLLGLLEDKTRSNLPQEEAQALARLLFELRSQFTEVVTHVAAAPPPKA